MAEAVYFATQHISSKITEGSNAITIVKSEVVALLAELNKVNKLLVGAEGRTGLSTSREIQSCIADLKKIACDAEDAVDTLESGSTTLRLIYFGLCPGRASRKLREIRKRTIEVKTKLDQHAEGSTKEAISPARRSQSPKSHLPANDDFVVGIDRDITKVVDQLIGDSFKKLAIVGMGGCGKTTLARSIYSNKAVMKHFDLQAWISVSQGLDTSTMLADILTQVESQRSRFSWRKKDEHHETEPNTLLSRLNYVLYGRRCLLVLDDVWDFESLNKFIALIQGDDQSHDYGYDYDYRAYKILITSRQRLLNRKRWNNREPQWYIRESQWYIHEPQCLTYENSWNLFSLVASNNSPKGLNPEYRPLAMEMLEKCQGLPLAIVALGRLLETKDTMREWQRVLSQVTGSQATSMYGPVNEILGLNYDQLPYYLKPCFLYLGLFPEGPAISAGTLIRMWIAEGFVESDNNEETIEVAGRRYLEELIDHTMVHVVAKTYTGKAKLIRIHDIMRDYCVLKARELDFLAVSSLGSEAIGKASRRMAINLSKSVILPTNNSHLRSLALFGESSTEGIPRTYLNLDTAVCQMYKLLRVLDILGITSPDGTLPKEIGNLIHLTYLRIRSTNIRLLPKSIGKLRNLLTLDYWDVFAETEVQVPNVLWKLEKLRHLYLPNEMGGSIDALKLHTLKDLISLWGVGGGDWMRKEMGRLSSNLSKLYVHQISSKDQLNAVLCCPSLTENCSMYALALEWYGFEMKLDALSRKQGLRKLRLIGQAPDRSPNQDLFASNLAKLELYYTKLEKPETMSQLGKLFFLKVLKLSKDSYIGIKWCCRQVEFQALEELNLTSLPKLEDWDIEEGSMPCLKKLSLVSCIKLKQMPEGLMFLHVLERLHIENMPSDFNARYQKAREWGEESSEGEDYQTIRHIPEVVIQDYS